MLDLKQYPLSLQLLMETDGTVTELIKLLTGEDIQVIKISSEIDCIDSSRVLSRQIFLQGLSTKRNWIFAKSKIYLDNLSDDFVKDLIEKNIPIGTLWVQHKVETFKSLISQEEELLVNDLGKGFASGTRLLTRVYQVFNQQKLIMEIHEKFPIDKFTKSFTAF